MKEDMKKFTQGFACATAVLISNHGEGVMGDILIRAGGLTLKECRKAEVDDYDISILRPSLKRIEKEDK